MFECSVNQTTFTSWNFEDSQLRIQDRELNVAKAQNYNGGPTHSKKMCTVRGGHHTFFRDGGSIGEGGHCIYIVDGETN